MFVACQEVCKTECEHGYVYDKRGCKTCKCKPKGKDIRIKFLALVRTSELNFLAFSVIFTIHWIIYDYYICIFNVSIFMYIQVGVGESGLVKNSFLQYKYVLLCVQSTASMETFWINMDAKLVNATPSVSFPDSNL